MDFNYYRKVRDYLPESYPSPKLKRPRLREFKSETLDELEIIAVTCELNEVF